MNLHTQRRANVRSCLQLAAVASSALLGLSAQAASEPVTPADTASYNFTLKQLGRPDTINLQGTESSDGVSFGVRADHVVTSARLQLDYSYSPALLADLSQINVLVNDEVAASLVLPKDGAGKPQQQTVEIPAPLISEFNRLRLQFIGHYTLSCEDPLHSSLWAKINTASQLQMQVAPIRLQDDLSILPLPFFDRRDSRRVELPVVFAAPPSAGILEAAGTLSSWIGALAAYRGARFQANVGQIPAHGSAIVLAVASAPLQLGELPLAEAKGPTVSLMGNPHDPYGKLLVITGRDEGELKLAANAVALGNKALDGASVLITHIEPLTPRQPYDAPNWLPTDRPVKLGELIAPDRLSVSGYNPGNIDIPLHLPPDLFSWRETGVPLTLKYRYTPQQRSSNSSLLVSFNDAFAKSMPLPSLANLGESELLAMLKKDASLPRESTVLLPLANATPRSQLQLRFMFDYIKEGECRDIIIDNMRGLIDPESTVDLRGYDHYIAMPNLGVFNDSGFPFTRLADLSQSAVVMPDGSGEQEWSTLLTVLGRFGRSTGYPTTGLRVVDASTLQAVADRDLLVIASGNNQPLLEQWAKHLPAVTSGARPYFSLSDLGLQARDWLTPSAHAQAHKTQLKVDYSGASQSTFLSGFESPLSAGRSVVVIAASRPESLADATAAMLGGEQYQDSIQGSLAVINGLKIDSLVAEEQYYVGNLGVFKHVQWQLARHPLLMLLVTLLGLAVVSSLLYLALRARARKRLA
ncbi:cellulose biosynthesis cyclic di-GMP-binding regulatory protein BcsB [Pseudomonas kurunegalensis]|uniref:cellulose biosynthesis cyclic di-GMP-binding regulatory protein BcsB n=1 Tax=Pseudomonas kurunegalensis TaxID=485880 RepID=UPI00256FB13D|nr:cellulose biosynthesis cyclic di-GMP-binding regulatory protein BcsB [Pseudomonas kurunegalensis]WJD60332.1 cellulose biosynthesis cyclic di-GMP-binding regulatory protein BcsB [Pseudomonas kurunegalensis]